MLGKLFKQEMAMKHEKGENDHYSEIYERWFQHKRFDVRTFLEIGIHKGGALRAWSRYFPGAEIYGIDIKNKFDVRKTYNKCKIKVEFGSAIDEKFMLDVYEDVCFDVIIDDASHMVDDQYKTFQLMYPRVKRGGVYIIEDTHTSYWPEFKGGYGTNNFIDRTKNIADYINYKAYKKNDRAGKYKIKESPTWLEENTYSISYFPGLCFIERSK